MSIPFTQFMMPWGRRQHTEIDMPEDIESLAQKFIDAGGWFESEMLSDMRTVSLTACMNVDDEPEDIAIEVMPNGPEIITGVTRLVRSAARYAGLI